MTEAKHESLLPWHQAQWQSLLARRQAGRLPHALLFMGPRGVGKEQFARLLAQSLLCKRPKMEGLPCSDCSACHLYRAGTHPDVLEVRPEEGKPIRVDQIRTLKGFFSLKSRGFKTALIAPAQSMNLSAANSLLKTLEEPPLQSLIVLVGTRGATIPATIRSRCQRVDFPGTHSPEALAWLRQQADIADPELLLTLSAGAPFAALEWAGGGLLERRTALFKEFRLLAQGRTDPVASAPAWIELGVAESLRWMIGWLGDMIRLKCLPHAVGLQNSDLQPGLQALADIRDLRQLYGHLDRLYEALKLVTSLSNINGQMLIEGVLIAWAYPTSTGMGGLSYGGH